MILGEWAGLALNAEMSSTPLGALLRLLNGE
jgi:hypothetical protein